MALRMLQQSKSGEEIIRLAIRVALLTFLLYWSFVLIRPFIPILAWSMILTVALYPAYNRLSVRLGDRPKLAAAFITVINLAIIIGPAMWTGFGVIDGLQSFAGQLGTATLAVPSPPDAVKDWPIVGAQVYSLWDQAATNLGALLRQVAPHLKPLAGPVLAFAGSAGVGTLKFIVSVGLSGFLFLYGPRFVGATRRIQARLMAERSQDFVSLAGRTIRTVAQGVIGVAALQALLAGIGLKLAGVPHAGVMAFAVLILAILQIGSAIVLFPIIIWIWATKDFAVALPLTIYLLIVGLADNILKPVLMGRGLGTPTIVIFVGVIGGMLTHGIIGLFIGPVILAVSWELTTAWIREDETGLAPPVAGQDGEKLATEGSRSGSGR
jgi:predicted PurR-regulated permease PerM